MKSRYLILFAVCLVSLCGALPTYVTQNWDWLERSGSLLTIYGAVLVYLDLSKNSRRDYAIFSRVYDLLADDPDVQSFDSESATTLKAKLESLHLKNERNHFKINLIMAITGTLLWGYGSALQCIIPLQAC